MDTYKPMDNQTIANGYIQTNGHTNYSNWIHSNQSTPKPWQMDTYKPMDTQTIANGYIPTNGQPNYSK